MALATPRPPSDAPSTHRATFATGAAPSVRFERWFVVLRLIREWALWLVGLCVLPLEAPRPVRRKRLAFQAYATHLAQFYATIIEELRGDRDVELEFVVLPHPHLPLSCERELRAFARERLGFQEHEIRPFWRTLWRRYDALVCADVYARFPLRRATRTVLLRHGPGVTRRHVARRRFRKTVFEFDLCLAPGEHDREVLSAARGPRDAAKIVACGQPFLDRLGAGDRGRDAYFHSLALDPALPTVLFAPTWASLGAQAEHGARYFDAVVGALLGLDVNLVVKLHACSFHPSMAGGVDWRRKLAAITAARLAIDHDVDDVPALEHADVLVTDLSSRAFNFMLLGKPVVVWQPANGGAGAGPWERAREELLRRGSLLARSAAEVPLLVSGALAGTLSAPEARAVSEACFSNVGRATAAAVDAIRSELELPRIARDPRLGAASPAPEAAASAQA